MKCKCERCILPSITIFNELTPEQLVLLSSMASLEKIPRRKMIFKEHEKGDKIYIVKSGEIKLSRGDGLKDIIIKVALPGSFIGLSALFSENYKHTAIALINSMICAISKKKFLEYAKKDNRFMFSILKLLYYELDETEILLKDMKLKTSRQRLAQYLVRRYDIQQFINIPIKTFNLTLSRQEIAEYIGIVPETLSRLLATFPKDIISLHGKEITIKDINKLRKIVKEP